MARADVAVRIAHLLAASAAAIAPRDRRDEFRREWQAEIQWAASALTGDNRALSSLRAELVRRACGALVHAIWLRKEQWRPDMLWQDVKFGFRMLLSRPSFTLVAVLTLALGIGVNTAIFSVVYGVLLKPLPFHESDRLVQIWETNPERHWTDATASPANLLDWKRTSRTLLDIAFYPGLDNRSPMYNNGTLTGDASGPERVQGLRVSTNLFRVLGVAPLLGRDFVDGEDQPGRTRVAVLSHAFWRARFSADPAVLGRDILINSVPYRVVGVMPPEFRFPSPDVQVWTPFAMPPQTAAQRRPHWLRPIARLRPGVTIEDARADLTSVAAALEKQYPDTNTHMGVGLGPLQAFVVGDVRTPLLLCFAAVAVVLLVACTNLANLLLARTSSRRREFAVRAALGGAGWRLARQLLVESAMLAACGGALGLAIAHWTLALIVAASPAGVPRLDEVAVDGRMLAFVIAVTAGTALLFGMTPAWTAARADTTWLRDGTRTTGGTLVARRALVAGQVAVSVALVACAGLLLRSFDRLMSVPPGFEPDRAVSFRVALPGVKYDTNEKANAFFDQLLGRMRALPGVKAAGGSTVIGLDGQGWTGDLFVEGRPEIWGRELRHKEITPGYFPAMSLTIVKGRDVTGADGPSSPQVVVVNEAFARTFFHDEDPIGRHVTFDRARPGQPPPTPATIIGVVRDEKQNGLDEQVAPEVYAPTTQNPRTGLTIVVRSETAPASLVPALRHELSAVDGTIAMFDVRTLREVVDASVARQRFTTSIVALFALLALTIAAIGVYGVVSYSVSGRTREFGVRIALGATGGNVAGLVLREAFNLLAIGLAVGLMIAVAGGRAIRTLLFETAPTDLLTYALVIAVLMGVGFVASLVPVRRALRVDPNVALRYE